MTTDGSPDRVYPGYFDDPVPVWQHLRLRGLHCLRGARMGLKSRQKGKRIERYVANLLKEIWPNARRGLTQSRGATEPDVTGTPFWVEVKGGKNPPKPEVALLQATKDQLAMYKGDFVELVNNYQRVLVVIKKDRCPPRFYLEDTREACLVEVTFDTLKELA